MKIKRVAFLFDPDSSVRERLMIIEGLNEHPHIYPSYNNDDFILGNQVAQKCEDIERELTNADLIIRLEEEHFSDKSLLKEANRKELLKKTAYLDFQDEPTINSFYLENCKTYFKRSWPLSAERRHPDSKHGAQIYPITYAALNCYFLEENDFEYDVACFFDESALGRRKKLREAVYSFNWPRNIRTHIGSTVESGRTGRQSITSGNATNPWFEYIQRLNRSRIVCTALPHRWDGDSRTWEALASGATVCMDHMATPLKPRIKNQKHALLYDTSNSEVVNQTLERVRYLLLNTPKKISRLAKASRAHVRKHHRGINRINHILSTVNRKGRFPALTQ